MKAREETIVKLLELCEEVVESLITGSYCRSRLNDTWDRPLSRDRRSRLNDIGYRPRSRDPTSCNVTNLGLFVRALYPLGLGSQKVPAAEVKTCISKIVQGLDKASDKVQGGSDLLLGGSNLICCSLADRLRPRIEEILNNIPSVVKEQHKRHMEEQAKKSGIGDLTIPEPKQVCILM